MVAKPGVIEFGNVQVSKENLDSFGYLQTAYQHVLLNLKQYSSRFVFYPFPFSYSTAGGPAKADEGAMFDLDPTTIPSSATSFFRHNVSSTNIRFGQAKGLYDGNIAVLRAEAEWSGRQTDLTYESSFYCTALNVFLGKYSQCHTLVRFFFFPFPPFFSQYCFAKQ